MQAIILDDGTQVDLAHGVAPDLLAQKKLSEHIAISEAVDKQDGKSLLVAGKLLYAFELIRARRGRPIQINSLYRTYNHQQNLKDSYEAQGKTGLTFSQSVHCEGMGMDLQADSMGDQLALRDIAREVNEVMGGYLRIGWKEYQAVGWYFVHVDVAPWFFNLVNGPLRRRDVPSQWRQGSTEW